VIHPEVRWEILCGFWGSDITGPQEDRIVFVDEGDQFVRETVVLA